MRELGLTLDIPKHLTEAIIKLKESSSVAQKRLRISESRIETRKVNKAFELNRRRFYTSLTESSAIENKVEVDKIKEFWGGMWMCRNQEESQNFEQYLSDFVHQRNPYSQTLKNS